MSSRDPIAEDISKGISNIFARSATTKARSTSTSSNYLVSPGKHSIILHAGTGITRANA